MNNKVELLRTLCFNEESLNSIKGLDQEFNAKEIEFIIEFKKIYELGTDQLKKFLDKLENEGVELDTYSILYYVNQLKSGPFSEYVTELTENSKYFKSSPDNMGVSGNLTRSSANTTLYNGSAVGLGCATDTYNKLPDFIQETLRESKQATENVFRASMKSSTVIDNTLPIVNKNNQERYNLEKKGEWVTRANGTYLVKDSYFYNKLVNISNLLFSQINEYLGEEDYRIYSDKKQYNPFGNDNESVTKKLVLEQETENDSVEVDILGDVYDSDGKRKASIPVDNGEKVENFLLNTNEGQLGN